MPKAITATAHKLARLIYSMLRYGQELAPNDTRVNINNGRCALQNGEHPNWATNWCLCQMLRPPPNMAGVA